MIIYLLTILGNVHVLPLAGENSKLVADKCMFTLSNSHLLVVSMYIHIYGIQVKEKVSLRENSRIRDA